MDSSLHQVWQAAAGSPFLPVIAKESQFTIAFALLSLGVAFTGIFALNRSLVSVVVLGVPASLAIAYEAAPLLMCHSIAKYMLIHHSFGTVYMFCAVGVYV
ncbi:hypothetical protein J3F84DRAFT_20286 [Trichoderma pleuroticola]